MVIVVVALVACCLGVGLGGDLFLHRPPRPQFTVLECLHPRVPDLPLLSLNARRLFDAAQEAWIWSDMRESLRPEAVGAIHELGRALDEYEAHR